MPSTSVDFRVEDFCYLILGFTIYFDRGRRWLSTIRNDIRSTRLQLGDMEDGVYGSHSVRKAEREGMRSGLSNNGVRAKVLLGKLLRRASRTEVLSFHEDLVTNFEVRRRKALRISGTLIALLSGGHFGTEEFVEFV